MRTMHDELLTALKAERPKTREYLEEALAAAKKALPGWQYAMIHQAALPRSGARARVRNLQATARLAAESGVEIEVEDESELETAETVLDELVEDKKAENFVPPKAVQDAAKRALEVRGSKPESERGMTAVGIARARDLSNGKSLSLETVRRMKAYFDRHAVDKEGETWDEQGKGWQAWMGWGGDDGRKWADKIARQADEETKKTWPEPEPPMPVEPMEVLKSMADGRAPRIPAAALEVLAVDGDEIEAAPSDADFGGVFKHEDGGPLHIGDVVDVVDGVARKSNRLFPMTTEEAIQTMETRETLIAMSRPATWHEVNAPRAIFLAATPSRHEIESGPISGEDREVFEREYLSPAGLSWDEVTVGYLAPHWAPEPPAVEHLAPWLKSLDGRFQEVDAPIVALGTAVREALGDACSEYVPHPAVVRKSGDFTQVNRKMRRLALAVASEIEQKGISVTLKAAREEEQIVYGIVLDPNAIDAHNDWAPPAEVQKTAHDYISQSRVVGLEHESKVRAQVVESFVETYPSEKDYKAAMKMQPHSITQRKFGDDVLRSGAWVLGVKLEDREWKAYKRGEITGFSMGGFSIKTDITPDRMPKTKVIELRHA